MFQTWQKACGQPRYRWAKGDDRNYGIDTENVRNNHDWNSYTIGNVDGRIFATYNGEIMHEAEDPNPRTYAG